MNIKKSCIPWNGYITITNTKIHQIKEFEYYSKCKLKMEDLYFKIINIIFRRLLWSITTNLSDKKLLNCFHKFDYNSDLDQ